MYLPHEELVHIMYLLCCIGTYVLTVSVHMYLLYWYVCTYCVGTYVLTLLVRIYLLCCTSTYIFSMQYICTYCNVPVHVYLLY